MPDWFQPFTDGLIDTLGVRMRTSPGPPDTGREPYPIQIGMKVTVTVEVSGSKKDVQISHCMDNHKDEEEYRRS